MESFNRYVNLDLVMTLSEASEKWGFSNGSTIRKAIERGKFKSNEIKRSGNVWLITYDAMYRVFGKPNGVSEDYIIYMDELNKSFANYILYKSLDYLNELEKVKKSSEKAISEGKKIIIKNRVEDGKSIILFIIEDKAELDRWIEYSRYYLK